MLQQVFIIRVMKCRSSIELGGNDIEYQGEYSKSELCRLVCYFFWQVAHKPCSSRVKHWGLNCTSSLKENKLS